MVVVIVVRGKWKKVEEGGGVGGKWRKMEGRRKVGKSGGAGGKWRVGGKWSGRRKMEKVEESEGVR